MTTSTAWPLLGNSLGASLTALAIFAGGTTLLIVIKGWVGTRGQAWAERSQTSLDDMLMVVVRRTGAPFLAAMALLAALSTLVLPPAARHMIGIGAKVLVVVQVALWANALVSFWIKRYSDQNAGSHHTEQLAISALGFAARVTLWAILLLLLLDNLGVNVGTLIAGLGIGGLAVALAVQSILGDLLGAVSIVVGKPFVIGDTIVTGDIEGTVQAVSLRATRIAAIGGEEVMIPNKQLLEGRVRNMSRMIERRVAFSFTLHPGTPPERAARVPDQLRAIVSRIPGIRMNRAHLRSITADGLVYEVVYHVLVPDMKTYLDAQQIINLDLLRLLADQGIQFAPTVAGSLAATAMLNAPASPRA